ncbi:UNKNOWN [Stylonychia lemnae]|uniref:Uncharacterized protein n=1 Tax=Stylonychia lemnae TaxID=5949 RepID=A0A078AQG6_STYLE|nr:UNKNOWN [Stylonychia lemnae]|eukprot:CDW84394.1 UNKNOWN [Stylonychia lemnae]
MRVHFPTNNSRRPISISNINHATAFQNPSTDFQLQLRSNLPASNQEQEPQSALSKMFGKIIVAKLVDISEYIVKFHGLRFIRVLVYHFLFFYIGMLVVPLIVLFDSVQLANNFQFFVQSGNKRVFIFQSVQFIFHLIHTLLIANYYFKFAPFKTELKNIFPEQYLFMTVQILIRCFLISVRHGYSSEMRYKLMTQSPQSKQYISKDLLLINWFFLTPDCIEDEIQSVFWRKQIEEREFKFEFFEKISDQDMKDRLSDDNYFQKNKSKFTQKEYSRRLSTNISLLKQKQRELGSLDPSKNIGELFSIHMLPGDNEPNEQFNGRNLIKEIMIFSRANQLRVQPIAMLWSMLKLKLFFYYVGIC